MITVPKPRFAKTNVPIGESLEDYRDAISFVQTHVLGDAIDRVSRHRDAVIVTYDMVHTYMVMGSNFAVCDVFLRVFLLVSL